jgi:hypothetical protein
MSLVYEPENDYLQLDKNNVDLVWVFMLLGSSLFTVYLWNYMLNYITSGLFKQSQVKQRVYIVRSMPSQNLEEKIVEYINQNCHSPHTILSSKTYNDELNNISERTFLRFMKKLYNTNCDIYVLTTNNHRSSYDNYIYFSDIFKVEWKIIDFVGINREEHKSERRIFDYENRERIVLELMD